MNDKPSGARCKNPQKCKLDVERFGYDVLSCILPAFGLPTTKLGIKGKENAYIDREYIHMVSAVTMTVALVMKDRWGVMFESRYKSSGLDSITKIESYLQSCLAISKEYSKGTISSKIFISLAAHSEIILYLNCKCVEIDFEQLLNLWSRHFLQHIAQNKNTDDLLEKLFVKFPHLFDYKNWIIEFVLTFASPYALKPVTGMFRKYYILTKEKDDETHKNISETFIQILLLVFMQTELLFRTLDVVFRASAPVLPAGFESQAVLPGDRKLPEPPEYPVSRGKKATKCRSTKSSDVNECRFGERQRSCPRPEASGPVLPPGFTSGTVLPGDRESPETLEKPISGRKKTPRRRRSARPTDEAEYGLGEKERMNISSEKSLEEGFVNMTLCSKASLQDSRGAIPKTKKTSKNNF